MIPDNESTNFTINDQYPTLAAALSVHNQRGVYTYLDFFILRDKCGNSGQRLSQVTVILIKQVGDQLGYSDSRLHVHKHWSSYTKCLKHAIMFTCTCALTKPRFSLKHSKFPRIIRYRRIVAYNHRGTWSWQPINILRPIYMFMWH